jgi:uncharacterized protein YjbJ (UPF0337 family)
LHVHPLYNCNVQPTNRFKIVKFNITRLVSFVERCLSKSIGGFLVLALVWHGIGFGIAPASASPLFATSVDSMSKQVSGKVEQIKGSAKQSMGKAQSAMEDKVGAAKIKVKDDLNETKIAVDASNARVENAAEKATEKVKNFFGK